MTPPDPAKQHAARLAADLVEPGMAVGLGSGTTATLMIQRLGQRVAEEGLEFLGVPTSRATADLASSFGIALAELDAVDTLDLDLDGADEVDNAFRMIKGRGGALLREKIVASAARRRVFIVGENKHVDRLGLKFPVPVEVSPFGLAHTESALRALGADHGASSRTGRRAALRDRRRQPDHRLPLRARDRRPGRARRPAQVGPGRLRDRAVPRPLRRPDRGASRGRQARRGAR